MSPPLWTPKPQVVWPDPRRLENDHLASIRRSSRRAPSGPGTSRCAAPSGRVSPGRTAHGEWRGEGEAGRLGGNGGEAVRPPFVGGEARVPGSPRALLSLIRPVQPGTGVASRAWRDASKPLGAVAAAGRRPSE